MPVINTELCLCLRKLQRESLVQSATFLLLLLLSVSVPSTLAFSLEGSRSSFVRFPKWYHAFENVISFELKTKRLNALVLYTDDGGLSNFYEVSLYDGKLRLRFKIGRQAQSSSTSPAPSVQTMEMDTLVSDDRWHRVSLYQFWEKVKLELDSEVKFRTLKQNDFVFGRYDTNSDAFVGGIPPDLSATGLSNPLVKTLDHFTGSIRNLVYRTLPHGITAPHILDSEGTRETDDDYCIGYGRKEPICRHKGICYSTNEGHKCDCSKTDYYGVKCEHGRCSI